MCENPEVIRALIHHGSEYYNASCSTVSKCNCNIETGDPNIRDSSGKTPLDYALEKGLHYCGLILTKAESVDAADESVLDVA